MCDPSPLKKINELPKQTKQKGKIKTKPNKKTNLPVFNGTQKTSVGNKVGFLTSRQREPSSRTNPLKDP